MVYISSDLHFGHDRKFIYEPRGFASIEEHDKFIIERWNSLVSPTDEVWLLGDLMLGADHDYGLNCLRRLNGNIHVIRGNHDTSKRWKEYEKIGLIPEGYSTVIKVNGYRFYLCHYKTETSHLENMAPLKNHLINLHGHTHSSLRFESDSPFQYNVALDAHNCFPVSIESIISEINQQAKECLSYL